MDIKTENEYYTEVFSWGSDRYGQLGLGVDMASRDPNYTIPRFCSYNITIRQVSCGLNHAGFVTCKCFASLNLDIFNREQLRVHNGLKLLRTARHR